MSLFHSYSPDPDLKVKETTNIKVLNYFFFINNLRKAYRIYISTRFPGHSNQVDALTSAIMLQFYQAYF
jgi:hypothetical protein